MIKKVNFYCFSFLLFFSLPFLQAQENSLENLIESWRKDFDIPGLSVGIIKDGEIILAEGFGVREAGKNQKADAATLYAIASNTKAFISASIAVLVKEGKVNWDDPVRKYLPYFELYDPCVTEMMTIRDLLCHRSGLGTYSGDVVWYRSNYSAEETVRRIAELEPQFNFRSGYGYSNVMFLAAGEVIRAVTGKSWDAFVTERFFQPLGMDHTITTTADLSKSNNVASPHKYVNGKNNPIPWVAWDNMGAAGGIISSVEDMLKWIDFQLNHGIHNADTLFDRNDQIAMWTPLNSFQVSNRIKEMYGGRNFSGYGLGWGVNEYHGRLVVAHTGGYDGMYSSVTLLPDEDLGIVVLTNSMTSIISVLGYELIDRILDLPEHNWKEIGIMRTESGLERRQNEINEREQLWKIGTPPSMTIEMITGLYRCPMYGDINIREENEELVIDFVPAPDLKATLTHWHDDVYRLDWKKDQAWFDFGTVQILKDNNGRPSGLLFDVPNDDIFFYEIEAVRVN